MKKNKALHFLSITVATFPLLALSQPANVKHFGKNSPFNISDLPTSQVKTKLQALSGNAQTKGLNWLHKFSFTEVDLNHLRLDNEGGVYYSDTFSIPQNSSALAATSAIPPPPTD